MNQQKTSNTSATKTVLFLLSCLSVTTAFSLEADKEQALLYSSDGGARMSIKGEVRLVEVSDNVVITRGSMEIRGDSATIEIIISTGETRKVTVVGTPVYYQQQLDTSEEPVQGSSNSISFYADESDGLNVIELIGDAVIESPTANFKCMSIIYIAEQDLIRDTQGPCSGVFSSSN
jgi:lipopolysaccharide transport protein LptA